MQILGLPAQRKFVSSKCHAHYNAQHAKSVCLAPKLLNISYLFCFEN